MDGSEQRDTDDPADATPDDQTPAENDPSNSPSVVCTPPFDPVSAASLTDAMY